MTAIGRSLLALALICALVSGCVSTSVVDRPPAPAETPPAAVLPPTEAATPPPVDLADGGLAPPGSLEVGTAASESPLRGTSTADPGRPASPAGRVPGVLPPSLPVQSVGSSRGVPILMYHYIRVNPVPTDRIGFGLSIAPADFESQMTYLESRGYRSVTIAEIASGAAARGPGRPVAITFDDGYDDAYTVANPILARHGFKATFYIITALVGRSRYMSWEQVRELAAAGNVIGSHTMNHRDLTRLDVMSLYAELAVSQTTLEAQVGQPVLDFCYPSGRYDLAVRDMVRHVGYRTAVTEQPGRARPGDDLLALPRVRVYGGVTLDRFAELVEGVARVTPTRAAPS